MLQEQSKLRRTNEWVEKKLSHHQIPLPHQTSFGVLECLIRVWFVHLHIASEKLAREEAAEPTCNLRGDKTSDREGSIELQSRWRSYFHPIRGAIYQKRQLLSLADDGKPMTGFINHVIIFLAFRLRCRDRWSLVTCLFEQRALLCSGFPASAFDLLGKTSGVWYALEHGRSGAGKDAQTWIECIMIAQLFYCRTQMLWHFIELGHHCPVPINSGIWYELKHYRYSRISVIKMHAPPHSKASEFHEITKYSASSNNDSIWYELAHQGHSGVEFEQGQMM